MSHQLSKSVAWFAVAPLLGIGLLVNFMNLKYIHYGTKKLGTAPIVRFNGYFCAKQLIIAQKIEILGAIAKQQLRKQIILWQNFEEKLSKTLLRCRYKLV